jgi:DNA-binding NarL/FixJ family response regulator
MANKTWILADNQDLTKFGLIQIIHGTFRQAEVVEVDAKKELVALLLKRPQSVVLLDYSLFNFSDASELLNIAQRFPTVRWILLSDDLTSDFLKRVVASTQVFSVVFKDGSYEEVLLALQQNSEDTRFVCSRAFNILMQTAVSDRDVADDNLLTVTEKEVLQMIATGMTTKEIAAERNLSFHTINAHRKNIFRKLDVNNVHEATKYAVRAGIISMSDYFI